MSPKNKMAETSSTLYLLQANDNTGLLAYYVLKLEKRKVPLLKKRLGEPLLDLREFGEIVESGYGEVPDSLKHLAN